MEFVGPLKDKDLLQKDPFPLGSSSSIISDMVITQSPWILTDHFLRIMRTAVNIHLYWNLSQ